MGVQSQLSNRMPVKSGVDKNGGFQYTPHKRRGPIAAEFQSPGPAAISLAGSVGKGPSKTMGIKPTAPKKYITPAPNKYEAKIHDRQPKKTFGLKHSPYVGKLKG